MALSCTISPKVKNPKGEIVDSILWKDLRSVLPYGKARDAYLMTKSDGFIERYGNSPSVKYDENGEPMYESIAELKEFRSTIDINSRVSAELKKIKGEKKLPATRENIDKLDDLAIAYNESEERDKTFAATTRTYVDEDGNENAEVEVVRNKGRLTSKVRELVNKRRLNEKLRYMLGQFGVHVDVLSEIEQKIRRATGVTDFESAVVSASGMAQTIMLARGHRGEEALPEEFSHFVIEALHDSPIIQRLYSLVLDNNMAVSILGDEYDRYVSEYEKQLANEDHTGFKKVFADNANRGQTATEHNDLEKMLAYEAIGHLIYERILVGEGAMALEEMETSLDRLMSRLAEAFESTVGDFDAEAIYAAINEALQLSGEFADALMNGELTDTISPENIATTARFYRLESRITDKKKLLSRLVANTAKRIRMLQSNKEAFDEEYENAFLHNLMESYAREEYDIGILDWADNSLEQIKALEEQFDTIRDATKVPMNIRTQILRNLKGYLQSYVVALSSIRYAQTTGVLEPSEERDAILAELSSIAADLKTRYDEYSKSLFIEILRQFVGEGITIQHGKTRGHTYTAEELAEYADRDISTFDRWLDSMQESGDFVLRIMDHIAKRQRNNSRLDTIEIRKKLLGALNKLKASGINDTEFMYDKNAKDEFGRPIHAFISPLEASKLSTPEQEYYATIMEIKERLDSYLPENTTQLLNAPAIRKSFIERLSDNIKQGNLQGAIDATAESVRDAFIRRADDTEFGGRNEDYEGNPIERLPIYFVNGYSELADYSTDCTATMLMYAKMANDYHYMNECVNTLEFMRDNMRNRQVLPGINNAESPVFYDDETVTSERYSLENSNIAKRMDDWFSSQVYGRYMKDEGSWRLFGKDIDKGKTANALNQLTALNKFALNILSGLSNVLTGSAMMRIEAIAGQWFSYKDMLTADKLFRRQLPSCISEIGLDNKTSKLALFDEMFNVLQDFESEVAEKDSQRSRFGRLMSGNSLYFINNVGEFWMQNRTALALANNYKMIDKAGNETSLWDALEVVMDENGVGHLEIKDGYTKPDGSKFSKEDIFAFTTKSKSINQRMHGIYNYEDRCAAQATAIGRLGLMFRKWIKTSLNRRYGSARYNFDLHEEEEGYYRSLGRFFNQLWQDAKDGQLQVLARFRSMDELARRNCFRAFADLGQLMLVSIAFALLKGFEGDDDDEEDITKTWGYQQMVYQAKRLQTEIGAMTPTPGMPKEALNILKSPAASISTAQGCLNLIQLIVPFRGTWTERVESGKYKGRTKAYKLFMDSPFIPFKETIYRGLHPKEQLSYY